MFLEQSQNSTMNWLPTKSSITGVWVWFVSIPLNSNLAIRSHSQTVEDLSLAFPFQIPTSYEAALTARLQFSVRGALSASPVGAGFRRLGEKRVIGELRELLVPAPRSVFDAMAVPRQKTCPPSGPF